MEENKKSEKVGQIYRYDNVYWNNWKNWNYLGEINFISKTADWIERDDEMFDRDDETIDQDHCCDETIYKRVKSGLLEAPIANLMTLVAEIKIDTKNLSARLKEY